MARRVQLNYDELRVMVKNFRDEGEDIAKLQVKTRDRVRDLHKDWEGESSEKFFKEMENELLPALSRLSKALFFAQDTLQKIIVIIHDHDEDTKGFFKGDFAHFSPEHLGALGGVVGVGGAAMIGGGVPIPFPNVSQGVPGGVNVPEPGPPDAPATGQAQGAAAGAGVAAQQGAAAGGGGGGGSAGAGQGLQGGLGSMGGGVGAAVGGAGGGAAGGGAAGGGAQAPDHVYGGAGGGSSVGGGAAQGAQGGGSGGGAAQASGGGEGAAAAGAAGVAGGSAAAGGAGKAIKGRVTKKKK